MDIVITSIVSALCGTVIGIVVGEPLKYVVMGVLISKTRNKRPEKVKDEIVNYLNTLDVTNAEQIKNERFNTNEKITLDIIVNVLRELEYEEIVFHIDADGSNKYTKLYASSM